MSRAELTEWRSNVNHLVDAEGYLVSEIDRALETALSTVVRSARSQRKTITQRIAIGSGAAQREHTIMVTVTRTGMNDTDLALQSSIDGHRVVTGREVFCAKMLAKHGECQLRAPNSVILKVVRNPATHRPTFAESQQVAPKPEHCPCKSWGNPHPGTHYPTCQWNRLAPPEERAPSDQVPEADIRILPKEAFESLKARPLVTAATHPIAARVDPRAAVVEPKPLDSPENCRNGCQDWAMPKGQEREEGQHHPMCTFAKDWAIKTARETPRFLVDLRTGEKVRSASDSEIGESEITKRKTGQPIIHIDEVPYAVLLQSELDENDSESLPRAAGAGA
ncbi:MAG TPA: hypothetical protein VGK73_04045 [Polyangiaceae bacterium]